LAQQLTLDLGHRPVLGREDFLVAESNAAAVALIDQWPHWPSYGAVISGLKGSGKSHLAEVWRTTTGASYLPSDNLSVETLAFLGNAPRIIVENLVANAFDETALFHTLNYVRQNGGHILITAEHWPLSSVRLPDLISRLRALPAAVIEPPDDGLLRGVLVKLFADRQIPIDEQMIKYLLTRMPRSFEAARNIVAQIDAKALEAGVGVTRAFAGKVLADLDSADLP
jgi:chromosomal replication initiation ATPase DnaA